MTAFESLLEYTRTVIRQHALSSRTEQSYIDWIYRFLMFYQKRNPQEMGAVEVASFLSYLATDCHKSASTRNQALYALLFLYNKVLEIPLPSGRFVRAPKEKQLPLVFNRTEISAVLAQLSGTEQLLAGLLYGSGLRKMEVMQLRVKDIDPQRNRISVWQPNTEDYRYTLFPVSLKPALAEQIHRITQLYQEDIREGFGEAYLSPPLRQRHPGAAGQLRWQFLFPSVRRIVQPETGREVRQHLHESVVQKAVKEAIKRAGLNMGGSCHTLRHSFAVHLLENGCQVKVLKDLLGHRDIRTTMLYTQIVEEKQPVVMSPLDAL
jgi:integron integrase